MLKTIVLKRVVDGQEHKTTLKEVTQMHFNIVDKLVNKCLKRGIAYDKIESIFDSVIDKY